MRLVQFAGYFRSVALINRSVRLAAAFGLALMSAVSFAQTVQLSAEEQRMLDQLPPAQRAQALGVLQRVQGGQAESSRQPIRETDQSTISPLLEVVPQAEEPRARARSRLVIDFTAKATLSAIELKELSEDPVLARLSGSRTFELDDNGVLSLLGVQTIPLLGLTESDTEQRLGAEPLLSGFDIDVLILDSEPIGAQALEPFGYDVFELSEASFDPPMTGPVPPDYVLGPGDSVRVQYFGNVNGVYEFDVSRDGVLNLPEIGPVTVAGLQFSDFREDISRRVKEMLIGTQVSVSMGQLRTIRIFVLGDTNRPGSYVVDSLATISSALYRSGGISRVGSLRDIQLKRNGRTVSRFDLYDLLLKGDTSGDSRLRPGDVIFVSPIGAQVSVAGAVKRPAIYETRHSATVSDLIAMAGGLMPDAFPDGARIERIESGLERTVVSIDADDPVVSKMSVNAGDVLIIPNVLPDLEGAVSLTGYVHRPGPYQWRRDMRLTDLIGSALELRQGADMDYVLIRRENPDNQRVSMLSANLSAALASPSSDANVTLTARDTVFVFSMALGRQRVIEPILDELKVQSRFGEPYHAVSVFGQVKAPGTYPLESGMRVSDLIRAGGNLAEEAYALAAEIVRYEILNGETRHTAIVDVDLDAILRGDGSADIALKEHDFLRIDTVPNWDSSLTVELDGEFMFPGLYRIRRGETLRQLVDRAGGLTDEAFPEGAVFLRDSLREREQEQIDVLAQRLESDLASLSLESVDTTGTETLSTGRALLTQLRATEAAGRLVIDLERIAAGSSGTELIGDVELREGDRVLVPKRSQEVTVIGEIQQRASHLYQPGLTRQDYIEMSGGLTRRADKKLIYVVRASGAIVAGGRSRWLGRGKHTEIRPGDTVVVPLETDRIRPLAFWGSVTQILYQGAIAVAAVKTFDD